MFCLCYASLRRGRRKHEDQYANDAGNKQYTCGGKYEQRALRFKNPALVVPGGQCCYEVTCVCNMFPRNETCIRRFLYILVCPWRGNDGWIFISSKWSRVIYGRNWRDRLLFD